MPIARTKPLAGPAPHPGEVLRDEIEARGLSAHALALSLRLPASRISQIVRGRRAMTPETALRLGRYFGARPRFGCAFRSPTICPAPKPSSQTRSRPRSLRQPPKPDCASRRRERLRGFARRAKFRRYLLSSECV